MCDGFSEIAAIGGLAASAIGTGISYIGSMNASNAAQSAQAASIQAQNTAFQSRLAAQEQQTAEQASVQDKSQATYLQEEQAMRQAQDTAQSQEAAKVNQMNQQSQQVTDAADAQVNKTTQQVVTPQTLADAQAQSEAQRNAGTAPVVQDIQASSPLPASGEGSATKSALADAMTKAADYTQTYGANLAKLGSYSAPVQTANIASKELSGNLMPVAIQDQLLKSGAQARLLPSELAYSQAGTYGKAAIDANTANTSDAMTLAATRAKYAEDEANQYQSDTDANIQSGLNVAQARAASLSSLGQGISTLGNAGITYGAATGGFSDLFGSGAAANAVSKATDLSPSGLQSVLKLGGDQYVP